MSLTTNPYDHLQGAAHGDLAALRALALHGEALAIENLSPDSLLEGLVFARLAAVRGAYDDTAILPRMLVVGEEICAKTGAYPRLRESLQGELLAVVSGMADAGVEEAANALGVLAEVFTPHAGIIAKAVRDQMMEAAQ